MSGEVEIEGSQYISSKRASELSGYAQDYIGQLARASLIDARRIGGLWYVSLESLDAYKVKADDYKPELPKREQYGSGVDSMISFDGKQYVSAAHAAKTTGYHQDYVGQLARSGKILSRQIGNRWYVDHKALASHKQEKDALLGAVQSESVGIPTHSHAKNTLSFHHEPFFTYTAETDNLTPTLKGDESQRRHASSDHVAQYEYDRNNVSARDDDSMGEDDEGRAKKDARHPRAIHGKINFYAAILPVAFSFIIVIGVGLFFYKSNTLYAFYDRNVGKQQIARTLTANAANSARAMSEWIEGLLSTQLTYTRSK